jgi:hypothetical protein
VLVLVQLAVLPFTVQFVSVVVVCPCIEWRKANVRTTSIATLRVELFIVIEELFPSHEFVGLHTPCRVTAVPAPPSDHYFRTVAG